MFQIPDHPTRALLIEDIPQYQRILTRVLAGANIQLDTSHLLADGIAKASEFTYDVVLLDLGLPDSQGLSTYTTFHHHIPSLPVIILSVTEDQQLASQAVQNGAQDYLVKGSYLLNDAMGKDILCRAIAYAIERNKIQRDLFNAHATLEERVVSRTAELRQANRSLANELAMRKRYEFIANASKDLLSLIDRNYLYQAVNDAYCLAQNFSRSQIVGKSVSEIWGAEIFDASIKPRLDSCFAGEETSHAAWFNFYSLGYKFYEVHYYPYFDENHQVTHAVVVTRDETLRELARNKVNLINTRLHILHEMDFAMAKAASPAAILDIATHFLSSLMPFTRADLLLLPIETQAPTLITCQVGAKAKSRQAAKSYLQIFTQADLSQENPKIIPALKDIAEKNGVGRYLVQQGMSTCVLVPLSAEGKRIGLLGLSSNESGVFTPEHVEILEMMMAQFALTLRNVQLFVELRQANKNLIHLTSRLISAQEEERRRISLELHDEAGQYLTALKLSLSVTQDLIPLEQDKARDQCEAAIQLTTTTMEKLRSLAHTLRPPALDMIGLDEAIKDSCNLAARQSGIQIDYNGLIENNLPEHIQITIFRMVQEGLTNIVKHSNASQAAVRIFKRADTLLVEIQDNGRGFIHGSATHSRGLGLIGMQERLDAVGGKLSISSQPGNGTRLVTTIPLKGAL